MKMIRISLFIWAALLNVSLFGQEQRPTFVHLGINRGLSQLSVLSLTEDSNGFMWIGTADGLNKVEGDHIKVYRHIYNAPRSIIDDEIQKLSSTVDGGVVACTKFGVSLYRPETDSFISIDKTEGTLSAFDLRKCPSVLPNKEKWLLLSIRGSMLAVNPFNGERDTLASGVSACCYAVKDSCLYFGDLQARVYRIKSRFSDARHPVFNPHLVSSTERMMVDKNGHIWIALSKSGVIDYNPQDGTYKRYTVNNGLTSDIIRGIEIDDSGTIWIAGGNNITLLDPDSGTTLRSEHDFNKPESLSASSVKTICKDRNGAIWIGTFYGGVDYYNPHTQPFHSIILPTQFQDASEGIIRVMSTDPDGSIWVGTSRSGIYNYHPQTRSFNKLGITDAAEDALNAVAYHEDGRHVLFGRSYTGLSVYDKAQKRVIWRGEPEMVFSISQKSPDAYIIGTIRGLKLFDFKDMSLSNIVIPGARNQRVFHTYSDNDGYLWVGLSEVLIKGTLVEEASHRYSIKKVEEFQDIRQVQDICREGERLWFASKSGLFRYDYNTNGWSMKNASDGFSTNLIRGIEKDIYGHIWVATDRSILWVEPESFTFQEYDKGDGIINDKFNSYAHCQAHNGTICFGGSPGICYFTPTEHPAGDDQTPPFVSSLFIDGERFLPVSNEIHIPPGPKSISLTISNKDFFSKDVTEYKMDGVDNGWQHVSGDKKTISYSNLPPGKNIFRTRTVRASGLSYSEEATIAFIVGKYWYQTTTFIILAIVCFLMLMVLLAVWEIHRSNKEISRIREQAEGEIRASKVASYMTLPCMNKPKDVEFMTHALSVVEENLADEHFSVETFASCLNMSRSNLHLRMTTVYGASATSFIRRLRIEKSMEYLREGKLNIAETAYAVGFSSATYFATAFKQVTGVNPTEWKQSCKQNS